MDPFIFFFDGLLYSPMQPTMTKMVDRVGPDWEKSALEFVHALGSGLKMLPPILNAGLNGRVVAQLKMQRTVIGKASPVPTIKMGSPLEAQGRCHHDVVFFSHKHSSGMSQSCMG